MTKEQTNQAISNSEFLNSQNNYHNKLKKLNYQQSKELKHQLLNDGSFKMYRQYRKQANLLKLNHCIVETDDITGQIVRYPTTEYYEIEENLRLSLIEQIGALAFKHCEQIDNNGYNRVSRLRKRLKTLLENEKGAYFITFTFNDEYLEKLNDKTKRVMVSRTLKDKCSDYVANVDYGGDSEYYDKKGQLRKATARIHFHAVSDNPITQSDWQYGYITCIKVRQETEKQRLNSIGSIPPYLDKLTKHAKKLSTKNLTPIYSRQKLNLKA